jgi:hypothetical protein
LVAILGNIDEQHYFFLNLIEILNLKLEGAPPANNSVSHRNSFSSIGQAYEKESVLASNDNPNQTNRQCRSNTNSIDRNSHFRDTNDNFSLQTANQMTNSRMDIKEFQKKLINLPTFTISDEASACLLPNSISTLSLISSLKGSTLNLNKKESSTNLSDATSSPNKNSPSQSPSRLNLNTSCVSLTTSKKELKATVSTEIVRLEPNKTETQIIKSEDPNSTTVTTTTTTITTVLSPSRSSIPFIITKPSSPDNSALSLASSPKYLSIEVNPKISERKTHVSVSPVSSASSTLSRDSNKSLKMKKSVSDCHFQFLKLKNNKYDIQVDKNSNEDELETKKLKPVYKKKRSLSAVTGIRVKNLNESRNEKRRKSENYITIMSRLLMAKRSSLSLGCLYDTNKRKMSEDRFTNDSIGEDDLKIIVPQKYHKPDKSPRSLSAVSFGERIIINNANSNGPRWIKQLSNKATNSIKKSFENIFNLNRSPSSKKLDTKPILLTPVRLTVEQPSKRNLSISNQAEYSKCKQPHLEHGISKSISNIFFNKSKEATIVKSKTNFDHFSKENLESPSHDKPEKINLRLFKQNVKSINSNKINKELLSAPKARRVRSNSPAVSKIKFESPSGQNSQISVNEMSEGLLKPHGHKYNKRMKSNDNTHKSHNHLLTIGKNSRLSDKSSMKSSESTNSTFSAGFLPSPEMNSPSAISLLTSSGNNMSNNDGSSKGEHLDKPCVTSIVLAAAKIGSSIFLSDEQQKELNDKLNEQKKRESLVESGDIKALVPVKLNVKNERRSMPNCMTNLETPSNLLMPRKSLEIDPMFAVGTPNDESPKAIVNETPSKKLSLGTAELQVNSRKNSCAKPGQEVLTLISTWIKNAPNDFMDTRVLDEVKHFFNQLDALKSSFRPWTKRLKQALKLDVT